MPEKRVYNAYLRIMNEKEYAKDEIEEMCIEIAEDVGLSKADVSYNDQYLTDKPQTAYDVASIHRGDCYKKRKRNLLLTSKS